MENLESKSRRLPNGASVISVLGIVSLNLFGAWILKESTQYDLLSFVAMTLIGLVIVINLARFVLWAWLHKRVDLSKSYPLTAIFYPMIAVLSVIRGEVIQPLQWFGIFMITLGVFWFGVFVQDKQS